MPWNVMLCSLVDRHQCFQRIRCLHFQSRRDENGGVLGNNCLSTKLHSIPLEKNGIEVTLCLAFWSFKSCGICHVELQIVIGIFGSSMLLSNVSYCLHDGTSQKTRMFIRTALRMSQLALSFRMCLLWVYGGHRLFEWGFLCIFSGVTGIYRDSTVFRPQVLPDPSQFTSPMISSM
jgi:hypothetical protein